MERSVFVWYTPDTTSRRAALRSRLLSINASKALVKINDGGTAWIPGEARGGAHNNGHAPQWAPVELADLAGLELSTWGYVYPDDPIPQALAAARALALRWPDDNQYCINAEVEFWHVNDAKMEHWVSVFRDAIRRELGRAPILAGSSCPTWHRFPYEGFARACDGPQYPQHYWPDNLMSPDGEAGTEAGEDQVEAHMRRAPGVPQIPIITSSREYDDAGVIALAVNALHDDPGLRGFSAWEAGNAAMQFDAMAEVFRLLPDDTSTPDVAAAGIGLSGGFRKYYEQYPAAEALRLFGLPLTGEIQEAIGGQLYTVQYFERARMEWHPGAGTPHDVLLGRLGADALAGYDRPVPGK